jgi:ubiquinone/menaquinone biosynthesis C-methylase UbiE
MPDRPSAEFFSEVDASGLEGEAQQYLQAMAARVSEMRRQGYELMGVAEGWSVLDVGGGLGEVCADLVEVVGAAGRVVGIDASSSMIGRAREQWGGLPIDFDVGDAEALGFADATFDGVRAERVIQHLNRPGMAIAEMARIVRPGGRVYVVDPVHDASIVATAHPEVWHAILSHGVGAIRQPRAGLFLKEWMLAAKLDVELIVMARVIDDWRFARVAQRMSDGATLAVDAGALTAAQVETFFAEQQRRSDDGVFAESLFVVHALGTKLDEKTQPHGSTVPVLGSAPI